jgi:hypothetical protein
MAPFITNGKRIMSDQPPVLTPAEVEANNHSENGVSALSGAAAEDGTR